MKRRPTWCGFHLLALLLVAAFADRRRPTSIRRAGQDLVRRAAGGSIDVIARCSPISSPVRGTAGADPQPPGGGPARARAANRRTRRHTCLFFGILPTSSALPVLQPKQMEAAPRRTPLHRSLPGFFVCRIFLTANGIHPGSSRGRLSLENALIAALRQEVEHGTGGAFAGHDRVSAKDRMHAGDGRASPATRRPPGRPCVSCRLPGKRTELAGARYFLPDAVGAGLPWILLVPRSA